MQDSLCSHSVYSSRPQLALRFPVNSSTRSAATVQSAVLQQPKEGKSFKVKGMEWVGSRGSRAPQGLGSSGSRVRGRGASKQRGRGLGQGRGASWHLVAGQTSTRLALMPQCPMPHRMGKDKTRQGNAGSWSAGEKVSGRNESG